MLFVSETEQQQQQKKSLLASQKAFCMKDPHLKRIQKTNIWPWMRCTLIGSLICNTCSRELGFVLSNVFVFHISFWWSCNHLRKKPWRRKPSEDVSTFILFAFVWRFCWEIWSGFFDLSKPHAELSGAPLCRLQCVWAVTCVCVCVCVYGIRYRGEEKDTKCVCACVAS